MDIRVPLYHKSRTGALHFWKVETEGADIISTHGLVTGQKVTSRKTASPKNVGRSNGTSAPQQAILEAQAMWTFKRERKYSLTPEEAQEDVLLPMLAQSFDKRERFLTYPLDVQPKLDGVRALARWENGKVVLISRSGKPWVVTTHINLHLEKVMPKDSVWDGEIYLHGEGFQWISARTKKRQTGTELLEFHVYDTPESKGDDSLTWGERREILRDIEEVLLEGCVKVVPTRSALSKEAVIKMHNEWVSEGYEGLIGRILESPYEYGHRSPSLLKLKDFQDSEYEIVGHTDGEGVEEGLVIWQCKDKVTGKLFDTRPRGKHEDRRKLFNEAESHYGEFLKVRYFGLTEDGLPRFPVGVGIRAPEDMS